MDIYLPRGPRGLMVRELACIQYSCVLITSLFSASLLQIHSQCLAKDTITNNCSFQGFQFLSRCWIKHPDWSNCSQIWSIALEVKLYPNMVITTHENSKIVIMDLVTHSQRIWCWRSQGAFEQVITMGLDQWVNSWISMPNRCHFDFDLVHHPLLPKQALYHSSSH